MHAATLCSKILWVNREAKLRLVKPHENLGCNLAVLGSPVKQESCAVAYCRYPASAARHCDLKAAPRSPGPAQNGNADRQATGI